MRNKAREQLIANLATATEEELQSQRARAGEDYTTSEGYDERDEAERYHALVEAIGRYRFRDTFGQS